MYESMTNHKMHEQVTHFCFLCSFGLKIIMHDNFLLLFIIEFNTDVVQIMPVIKVLSFDLVFLKRIYFDVGYFGLNKSECNEGSGF